MTAELTADLTADLTAELTAELTVENVDLTLITSDSCTLSTRPCWWLPPRNKTLLSTLRFVWEGNN